MTGVSNFAVLEHYDPVLARLGAQAERLFGDDPDACLYKLRKLGEYLARHLAERERIPLPEDAGFCEILCALRAAGKLPRPAASQFHSLRKALNRTVHGLDAQHAEALTRMREVHRLLHWVESTYGAAGGSIPRFRMLRPPCDLRPQLQKLLAEQEQLEARLEASESTRLAAQARLAEQAERLAQPSVWLRDSVAADLAELDEARRLPLVRQLERLQHDPSGFACEPFGPPLDPAFHALRLDASTMLAVARAPGGEALVGLRLGPREALQTWLAGKRVAVHPEIFTLQLFSVPEAPEEAGPGGLFAAYSRQDLLRCGVPPLLEPAVRGLRDVFELVDLSGALPREAFAALACLADGQDLATAQSALRFPHAEAGDAPDFETALSHRATRDQYVPAEDPRIFELLLRAPLDRWRVFLHPSQSEVVHLRAEGPVRVLGGAGTGKTVALLHRAVHLVRHVFCEPGDRILVTTFTVNLARDLQRLLDELATPDERARIEVVHLHKWARDFLHQQSGRSLKLASAGDRKRLMRSAVDEVARGMLPESFFLEEWEHIVQAHGVSDRRGYFKVPRRGRGTSMRREQKACVWSVFTRYRKKLDAEGKLEWTDAMREARQLLERRPELRCYRALLSDEVQDWRPEELRLLRALVPPGPDDLFLVGDSHQRIFSKVRVALSDCGIDVAGRTFRLALNYRTTERIRQLATTALADQTFDDLDGGQDHLIGYRSLFVGLAPVIEACPDEAAEAAFCVRTLQAWLEELPADELCVAARSHAVLGRLERALQAAGLPTEPLDAQREPRAGAVRLATMHRLKGTEFKRVLLAGIHRGLVPLTLGDSLADAVSRAEHELAERCLFYVAATRARDRLVISYTGLPSPFLE